MNKDLACFRHSSEYSGSLFLNSIDAADKAADVSAAMSDPPLDLSILNDLLGVGLLSSGRCHNE